MTTRIRGAIAVLMFTLCPLSAIAQHFNASVSSYVEPNQLTMDKDLTDNALWLKTGFGADFLKFDASAIGAEAVIWSRLRSLSDFRFPVETADYYFGLYGSIKRWIRFRLGHISSHLVDGTKDAIVGGSSSKFSRELVQVEGFFRPGLRSYNKLAGSVGVRYIFHQVAAIEFPVQPFGSFDYVIFRSEEVNADDHLVYPPPIPIDVALTGSFGAGPSFPSYTAGVLLRRWGLSETLSTTFSLLYVGGYSRAGVEGKRHEEAIVLGVKLSPSFDNNDAF